MATVKDYIETKLQRFNITISDIELAVSFAENGLSPNDLYTGANIIKVKKTFVSIIPELLLIAEVSEGDLTLKWNIEGIKAYYAMLCNELEIDDKLNIAVQTPKVYNKSNLW